MRWQTYIRAPTMRDEYPRIAEWTIEGNPPRSSAGGERPKFGALVDGRHLLVKFARRGGAGDAVRLRDAGQIGDEDARRLRWLDAFGAFIANTDRHQYNVVFFIGDRVARLAPAFDHVSMLYAPSADGQVSARVVQRPYATADTLDVWDDARAVGDFLPGSAMTDEARRSRDGVPLRVGILGKSGEVIVNVRVSARLTAFAFILFSFCFTTSAFAVDGVVLIDQTRALAGNVTPGDAPGFPVTISLPGSYRLSGNLAVPASTNGIEIAADNVTLDLNGFQIAGTNGDEDGVRTSVGGLRGIVVRNGTVKNFDVGISFGANFGAEISGIRAIDNTGTGISSGPHAVVTGNTATRNGRGIGIGAGSLASGNNVFENETIGMEIAANGTVLNNVANRHFNGPGIKVFCPANLIGNTSLFNGDNLEAVGGGCTFSNNNMP